MKRIILFSVAITLLLSWNLSAQLGVDVVKTGQTSMNFLQINVSPRAAALGNAYNALSQGVESIFSNPAGLPEMKTDFEVFVSSTSWFADIKYLAGAAVWNVENIGTFGIHMITVDYGTIKWTTLSSIGDLTKNYDIRGNISNLGAYSVGLTYVKKINDKFAMGGTIKYVGQQLGQAIDASGAISDNDASKVAVDLGVKYFPGIKSLRLGMYMRNFSTFVKYQSLSTPLPLIFSVGVGANLMDFINTKIAEDNALLVSAEFLHPNNYTERVNMGVEYTLMKIFSVRGGYESNHDILSWSGGAGVAQTLGGIRFEVDYSYSATKYFNGVNRFALNVAF
jgi:hypothetical protein